MKRSIGALVLLLALNGCSSPAESQGLPPRLTDQLATTNLIVEATWDHAVANAETDTPTAQWSDVKVLWSAPSVVLIDRQAFTAPNPPDPLVAWGSQPIDQYSPGDRYLLAIGFLEGHPIGDWKIRLALPEVEKTLENVDFSDEPGWLKNLPADLESLYSAADKLGLSKTDALIALAEELNQRQNRLNLGEQDPGRGPFETAVLGVEVGEPSMDEIVAEWRTIPVEMRSLYDGDVPEGTGISFVPLEIAISDDPALAGVFDGFRLITNEGYVFTHGLPMDVEATTERTVEGSDIRVVLYQGFGSTSDELTEVGIIPWSVVAAGPFKVDLAATGLKVTSLSDEEFQTVENAVN